MFDPHLLMLPTGVLACFPRIVSRGAGACMSSSVPMAAARGRVPGERFGYAVDPECVWLLPSDVAARRVGLFDLSEYRRPHLRRRADDGPLGPAGKDPR